MFNKCLNFIKKISNICKRIYQKQSLFIAVLLFIFFTVTPVLAKVSLPTRVAQTQADGQGLSYKAMELYRQGEFPDAAVIWQQAATIFAQEGDSLNQGMALSNLALSYQQLGKWEQANQAINDSLKILRPQVESKKELKSLELLAQALEIKGYLQRETGNLDESLQTWQEATQIYTQIDAPKKLAQSKINQAQTMQDMGFYPRACKVVLEVLDQVQVKNCQELSSLSTDNFQKKLELYKNESPSITNILALRSLGKTLRYIGQINQSEIVLETSSHLANKLNDSEEIAANYLSLANTIQAKSESRKVRRIREEDEQKALKLYQQVIDISSSPITQQQAKLNQLNLLLKREDFQEAEKFWKQIKPEIGSLVPSRTNIYLQLNFAQNLVKLAQQDKNFTIQENSQIPTFEEIEKILIQAATQAKELGDKSAEAYAVGYRGALYELPGKKHNLAQAEKLTKQALSIASTFENSDIAYQFFWQLGRIYKTQGKTENAISTYTKAYNALQSLRGDLVAINPEVQYSFRDSIEPVYRELVQLHLDYADSLTKSGKSPKKVQNLLSKAREVIQSLQLAEINDFFQEACVEAEPKNIDQIDTTAAVFYTIILPEKLGVILSLPNQPLKLHIHEITKKELEDKVEDVRSSLIEPNSKAASLYQELYSWLIQPFEKELTANKQIKNLAFVLDGELRNIPMSVLLDKNNKFLIEKYAVAVAPGLDLVKPKPITEIQNLRVLTAGLSELQKDLPAHQGFEGLPYVKLELEEIQNLGLSSEVILNQSFLTPTIRKEINAATFPIIHLATHGKFSSDVENTFILVWDNRINVKDLKNLLQKNQLNQSLSIELLVLSACETAIGDKRAALGLAGVAVRAGARSTLATLWSVADESTAELMREFYRQLKNAKKNNINKVQALQAAQLSLINNEKYKHPYFWAPFVIVGNWQ